MSQCQSQSSQARERNLFFPSPSNPTIQPIQFNTQFASHSHSHIFLESSDRSSIKIEIASLRLPCPFAQVASVVLDASFLSGPGEGYSPKPSSHATASPDAAHFAKIKTRVTCACDLDQTMHDNSQLIGTNNYDNQNIRQCRAYYASNSLGHVVLSGRTIHAPTFAHISKVSLNGDTTARVSWRQEIQFV